MKTFCTYYNQNICRSCEKIELDDQSQLREKETVLREALHFSPLDVSVTSHSRGFRNKAKVYVTGTIEAPVIGLQGEESLDQGREILNCPVHHPKLNAVFNSLPDFIRLVKLPPYSIEQRKGELKGAIAYYSAESDEMYLRLILRSEEAVTRLKKHLPFLTEKFSFLKVITANIQPIPHAVLEGDKEIALTSAVTLSHKLGGIGFRLGTQGFVQTNQAVATELYATAATWVKELKIDRFLELFSGQGAFSFFVSSEVKEALGVEVNADAVERANETARENSYAHLRFTCADAAGVEADVKSFRPDLLLVNPPRRGLGEALKVVRSAEAKYVIYSSCNHVTLAQDLAQLKEYKILRAKLFDMFPHTEHFETLVLLQRL